MPCPRTTNCLFVQVRPSTAALAASTTLAPEAGTGTLVCWHEPTVSAAALIAAEADPALIAAGGLTGSTLAAVTAAAGAHSGPSAVVPSPSAAVVVAPPAPAASAVPAPVLLLRKGGPAPVWVSDQALRTSPGASGDAGAGTGSAAAAAIAASSGTTINSSIATAAGTVGTCNWGLQAPAAVCRLRGSADSRRRGVATSAGLLSGHLFYAHLQVGRGAERVFGKPQ
jgi:hypothetical protein